MKNRTYKKGTIFVLKQGDFNVNDNLDGYVVGAVKLMRDITDVELVSETGFYGYRWEDMIRKGWVEPIIWEEFDVFADIPSIKVEV